MRVLGLLVAALAGVGAVRVAEALADAWRARMLEDEPPAQVWAAYSGIRAGQAPRGARLALFASEEDATAYASRRGLYVAAVPWGARVLEVISRAGVAPVIPWPADRPP